jgi:hypothetical protein
MDLLTLVMNATNRTRVSIAFLFQRVLARRVEATQAQAQAHSILG